MIKNSYNSSKHLKNAILGHEHGRHRRAVFGGVGTAMNWLFGTVTSKQFTDLDMQFIKLTKRTGDVTHIIQQHASLINETLWLNDFGIALTSLA